MRGFDYCKSLQANSYDCKIIGNTFSDNNFGILLWNSTNNKVHMNTCNSNIHDAIGIYDSTQNVFTNNTILNNYFGISLFSQSNNNLFANNTIQGNSIGIILDKNTMGNMFQYNVILENIRYGLRSDDDEEFLIIATHNYWGDPSGPYHPLNNSNGLGDNITDYVLFEPWLNEFGNLVYLHGSIDEESDASPHPPLLLSVLLVVLVSLFVALYGVVRLPDNVFSGNKISDPDRGGGDEGGNNHRERRLGRSGKGKTKSEIWGDSDVREITGKLITCQYCDTSFEIQENERAIRVACPECGKHTLNQ